MYQSICNANQFASQAPPLRMYNGSRFGASTLSIDGTKSIVIDTRLFDLTRELRQDSTNALAYVLAHELHHYFGRHFWCDDIARGFQEADSSIREALSLVSPTQSVESRVKSEAEADHIGAFYAYVAGYRPETAAAGILRLVYRDYGEPREGYPRMEERIRLVEEQHLRIRDLLPLYDAAVRLVVIGRYQSAAKAFEHLLQEFPSREMYNALGVALSLYALQLMPVDGVVFPFEIDLSMRAGSDQTLGRGEEIDTDEYRLSIERAIQVFGEAYRRDTSYVIARIHQASAQALLDRNGEQSEARGLVTGAVKQADRIGNPRYRSLARCARAAIQILESQGSRNSRDIEAASSTLKEAVSLDPGNIIALNNLQSLEKATSAAASKPCDEAAPETHNLERIGTWSAAATPSFELQGFAGSAENKWAAASGISCWATRVIVAFPDVVGKERTTLLCTRSSYDGASMRGIRIGDPAAHLEEVYGCTENRILASTGTYFVYPAQQIAFLSDEGKVTEWFVWW